jgi:outer membrane protein OmpA-like peptidoglycan-associated protein
MRLNWVVCAVIAVSAINAASSRLVAAAPNVDCTFTAPADLLVGRSETATVSIRNSGDAAGFAPVIDLQVPSSVTITAAQVAGAAAQVLAPIAFSGGPVTHPVSGRPVTGLPGNTLVVVRLPLSSLTPGLTPGATRLPITLTFFTTTAPTDVPLSLQASCAFAYGADARSNPTTDPPIYATPVTASSTPRVIVATTRFLQANVCQGVSDPTVQRIEIDIATGVSVGPMQVSAQLGARFDIDSVTGGGSPTLPPGGGVTVAMPFIARTGVAGTDLTIDLTGHALVGTVTPANLAPVDIGNTVIVHGAGATTALLPYVRGTASTTPPLTRAASVKAHALRIDETLTSVPAAPGGTVRAQLKVCVADDFSFTAATTLTSVLPNGTSYTANATPPPTTVVGSDPTTLTFALGALPGGAQRTFAYDTVIDEQYQNSSPVLGGDVLATTHTLAGVVTGGGAFTATEATTGSDASYQVTSPSITLAVTEINGAAAPIPVTFAVGDVVTYRVEMNVPSGGEGAIGVDLLLPPVFSAIEHGASGSATAAFANLRLGADHDAGTPVAWTATASDNRIAFAVPAATGTGARKVQLLVDVTVGGAFAIDSQQVLGAVARFTLGTGSGLAIAGATLDAPQLGVAMTVPVITGVDAGRLALKFRITNSGDGNAVAIKVRQEFSDALLTGVTAAPDGVSVKDLDGNVLPFTGDLFATGGLTLTNPLPGASGNASVAEVSFNVDLGAVPANAMYSTTAHVLSYSSAPGGGAYPELFASALITTKSFTVQNSQAALPVRTVATIGDVLAYTVTMVVPEGATPAAAFALALDPELVLDGAVTVIRGVGVTVTSAVPVMNATGFTIAFGTITNLNRDDLANEVITVNYSARVANTLAVQDDDDVVDTTARLTWSAGAPEQTSQPVDLEEPALAIAAVTSPTLPAQGGDIVTWTYSVTTPTGTTVSAYDVQVIATPDASLTNVQVSSTGAGSTPNDADTVTWTSQAPAAGPVTVTITAEVSSDAPLGRTITLPVALRWTSLPGNIPNERDGSGGAINDYHQELSSTVAVKGITFNSARVAATMFHTIGDLVDYRMEVILPGGVFQNLVVTQAFPPELEYVDATLLAAVDLLCRPGSGMFGSCALPAAQQGSGTVSWNFNDVKNVGARATNGGLRSLIFVARLRVRNVAAAAAGDVLATVETASGIAASPSSASFTLHEPVLAITGATTPITGVDGGDTLTLSGTVTNPAATLFGAAAYDALITTTSTDLVVTEATSADCAFSLAPGGLTLTAIPLGGSCAYEIKAKIRDSIPASSTISMRAELTWTSQPGASAFERGGADGYAANTSATTITTRGGSLQLITFSSTEVRSDPPELFAAEGVTYDLTVTVPDGVSSGVQLVIAPPPGVRLASAVIERGPFAGSTFTLTPSSALPRPSGVAVTFTLGAITASATEGQVDNELHIKVGGVGVFDGRNRTTPQNELTATLRFGTSVQGTPQQQPVKLLLPEPTIAATGSATNVGSGGTFTLVTTVNNHAMIAEMCNSAATIKLPRDYTVAAPGTDALDNDGDGLIDAADPDEATLVITPNVVVPLTACFIGARTLRFRVNVGGTAPLPHATVSPTLAAYRPLLGSLAYYVINPASDAYDTNASGLIDELNDQIATLTLRPDSDGDGASDSDELDRGTNPADSDSDDDGVLDGAEPSAGVDSDGDGTINSLDPDSDNDGLFDGTEGKVVTPSAGTDVAAGRFLADADPTTGTNPLARDSDGGGRNDGAEDANHDGAVGGGETDPNLGADDNTLPDSDGDGLSNAEELALGTSPTDRDSDDDGIADGAEANYTTDADGDALVQPLDADSDNDGILDGTEAGVTAPQADTDVEAGRFVADADPLTTTAPLVADTDRGGTRDGEEDLDRNGRVDVAPGGETNPRLATDDVRIVDFDGDGWSDKLERAAGTSPLDPDSDDDGVLDGAEPNGAIDSDGDGLINARDADSDNDGLFDGTELGISAAAPRGTDLLAGHYRPDADPTTKTNPLLADTDRGGRSDGSEDANRNGAIDAGPAGETNPNLRTDDSGIADSDGDGLSDALETALGTSPSDADSDDDGLRDGAEADFALDSDGDGALNALDPDSDNDGLLDGTERGVTTAGSGTNASRGRFVADLDPTTRTKMIVADTDRGGLSDGNEDLNKNGRVDTTPGGETNPLLATDDTALDGDGDGLPDSEEARLGTDPGDADSDDDGVLDGAEPDYASDSDGDGLLNPLDVDSDNDGLHDGTELGIATVGPDTRLGGGHYLPDADPTTRTSAVRADSDGGGVRDGDEDPSGNGRVDSGERDPAAASDDATRPEDSDGDGLSDALEHNLGLGINDADSDDDGVRDGAEPNPRDDLDGDGLVSGRDPDSDNDLLFDGTESKVVVASLGPDTDLTAGTFVPDGDPATGTRMLRADDDGGGVVDGAEDLDRDGRVDSGETDPAIGAGGDDGAPADSDGDGLPNAVEARLGTNPTDGDSDDDGVADGAEPNLTWDTDRDGLLPASDLDSDNDGLFDGTERGVTAPLADTSVAAGGYRRDSDPSTRTNMALRDTDRGGVSDGAEDLNKNGAVDSIETNPDDRADDVAGADRDNDGLSDAEETALGTDPNDADSDDDGVLDGAELAYTSDADGDGLIAPRDADSDNDGLFDGTEQGVTAPNAATDLTRGAFRADANPSTRTSPQRADTDGGGVRDGAEDGNRNGAVDSAETDPRNPADDGSVTDGDGDGLSDGEEAALGTSPNDADSDDDGVRDGAEPNWAADADGDGSINARDADSDNDRLFDGTELGVVSAGPGTDVSRGVFRADADSTTRTNPLLADTDGGGVSDGSEDIDRNGRRDAAPETDPNLRADDTTPSDRDSDGLPDAEELALGTNPDDADTDDDGVRDGREPNLVSDTDGDGLINPLDPDSDNDGILDGTESGLTAQSLHPNTDVTRGNFLADADPTTQTNPLLRDTDGGGLRDGAEDPNRNGRVDAGERDPRNRADDLTLMADGDGDGLTDAEELFLGTSATDADSDDDGVLDGDELNFCCDTDRDGLGNALDADSDGDGVRDGTEQGITAASTGTDTARGNFVADADPTTTTRMLVRDSDGGGVIDGLEDRNSNGLVDGAETDARSRGDDDLTGDADGDTLYDVVEDVIDSDGDGVRDFLDLDSDGDTLRDADEAGDLVLATAPRDSDGDGVADYRDLDSDGDTLRDSEEAGDRDLATPARDRDGDGVADSLDLDSDGDTRSDAIEAGDVRLETPAVDTDADGTPDFLDLDSDGDLVIDSADNCAITSNPDQADENRNGIGNLCEGDDDGDGVLEVMDNCPGVRNPSQRDVDRDGLGDDCDPDANGDGLRDDLSVEGGCSAAGGGGGGGMLLLPLLLVGLLLRRRRGPAGPAGSRWRRPGPGRSRSAALLAGAALVALGIAAAPAQAQPVDDARDFPVDRLRWSLDSDGILGAEVGAVPRHGSWGAALWVGYARAPLVLYAEDESGRRKVGDLVSYRLSSELSGSVAVWGRLQLGLAAPLILSQNGDQQTMDVGSLPGLGGTGLGDLRATIKLGLFGAGALVDSPLDVALSAAVTFPSGSESDYRGEPGSTIAPELAVSYARERTRFAANLGWKIRGKTQLLDLVIDDELSLILGAGHRLPSSPLSFEGNVALATAASGLLSSRNRNNAELLAGPSYDLPGPLLASLVGGVGLADGVGTPQWRVLLALRFGAAESVAADRDGDSVFGDADECPSQAEDRDGFEDEDGCPELDNDGDGVPDADDGAPTQAEDKDGFEDRDGVPDLDNDNDGVLDEVDGCPDDAETVNGFEDEDGCPDALPDGDGDGVRDQVDACPKQAEDLDRYEDDDGCPEFDNDGDQVADAGDRCPLEAGPAGNNGCPDVDGDGDGVVDRLDNCPEVKGQLRYKGCGEKQLVTITASRLELAETVRFKSARGEVDRKSFKLLDNVVAVLVAHPEVARVEIEGHTDDQGDDEKNKALSQQRAEAVMGYLVSKGIAADRLRAIGYGEEQPIADNKRSRGRAANRRVVLKIVGGAGGGAPAPAQPASAPVGPAPQKS